MTFDLDRQAFAVPAAMVMEILDPLPETPVPGASPLVSGIINFRGRVIPLADLRVAFGMARAEITTDARVIVMELELAGEPMLIGIQTDRVNEVTTLFARDCEPPPALGLRWPRELVRTLVRRGGDIIVLPDLATLFARLLDDQREPATL